VRGLLVLGWALVALPLAAHAGNLGTIDVTAERHASPTAASSVPVTIIDRKTIVASHARNVAELLQGQADIVVRDTSGIGIKPQVDLGGFGESGPYNSLVLIDGRRVNSPDLSGVDWNQIPLDQIERIEILHGSGASLYGSGAVGGVINIITRIPEAGGHVSVRLGSFGGKGAQASLGMDNGRTRVETHVSAFRIQGYRDNGGYNRFDGGLKAESDPSPELNLRLSGNYHHDRMGLPGALSAAQMATSRTQTKHPDDYARTNDGYADAGIGWHRRLRPGSGWRVPAAPTPWGQSVRHHHLYHRFPDRHAVAASEAELRDALGFDARALACRRRSAGESRQPVILHVPAGP
jgi:outer membrane cobalamin receptor